MTGRTADERRADNRGTVVIVAGTAVSALSVLIFEVISGRSLGADSFSAIGVLWTIGFIVFTVLMLPIEAFITRTLVVSGGDAAAVRRHRILIASVLAAGTTVAVVFTALTLDRFFEGNWTFVAIVAVLNINRSILASGRGFLAGRRRFTTYGVAVALEGGTLVGLAAIAAVVGGSVTAFGWAMAFAPLSVLIVRPFQAVTTPGPGRDEDVSASAFLGWLLVATASAQLILAGGPIIVGLIGGSPAAVSIVFVTFTLFRGPITSAYNLVARVLPDFTSMASQGRTDELHTWSWRLVIGGLGFGAIAFVVSAAVGPRLVGVIYGSAFEPSGLVAGLGGAGVGAGLAVLFVHQIYVAKGNTRTLAALWLVALIVSTLVLLLIPGTPIERVAAAFAAGEVAALLLLGTGVAVARE